MLQFHTLSTKFALLCSQLSYFLFTLYDLLFQPSLQDGYASTLFSQRSHLSLFFLKLLSLDNNSKRKSALCCNSVIFWQSVKICSVKAIVLSLHTSFISWTASIIWLFVLRSPVYLLFLFKAPFRSADLKEDQSSAVNELKVLAQVVHRSVSSFWSEVAYIFSSRIAVLAMSSASRTASFSQAYFMQELQREY